MRGHALVAASSWRFGEPPDVCEPALGPEKDPEHRVSLEPDERKFLSERPTRPRVLRGGCPRALNYPVRRASISDAYGGNDICSART